MSEEANYCQLWGVLLGGGIGIVTTLISLGYNWLQQRAQRQFGLRQSVYIEVTEWAAGGVKYLSSFWRTDIDDNQLAQLAAPGSNAVYKVHVVGERETLDALTAASECLALKSIELMKTRVLLRNSLAKLQVLQNETAQSSTYLQQLASIIEGLPKSDPTPEIMGKIPDLVVKFTSTRDDVIRKQNQITALQTETAWIQKCLTLDGLKAALQYQEKLIDLNIAARKELGIPLDEEKYRSSFTASTERMLSVIKQTFQKMEDNRKEQAI